LNESEGTHDSRLSGTSRRALLRRGYVNSYATAEIFWPRSEQLSERAQLVRLVVGAIGGFAALWLFFYTLSAAFPYLAPGSLIVYRAKLNIEQHGEVFPVNAHAQRLLIFGDSRVLTGFIPDEFDRLAASEKRAVYSFNSGFPGHNDFVHQLKVMAGRGQAPDTLLLTLPWNDARKGIDPFNIVGDDHEFATKVFPFRFMIRDVIRFLLASRERGGPVQFYATSHRTANQMLEDRGYYFIAEHSRFAGDRLPDDFSLDTDRPGVVEPSRARPPMKSTELEELRNTITQYHISCYYVPYYERRNAYAPAPPTDEEFAHLIESQLPCKVLGPRYFSYQPEMFSDLFHLNREGAKVYTQALYRLVTQAQAEKR
jgi:hypothetical protein